MRFLFAVALTSLVLFESIEVATPGPATSRGVRSDRGRGASCEAAARPDRDALMCRTGSTSRAFDDGARSVAD